MAEKPIGTFKCSACGTLWEGSRLYQDPTIRAVTWTCGNLMCGAQVRKISDLPLGQEVPYLVALFVGERVRITHTNERVRTVEGICIAVHAIPGEKKDHFDIELEGGHRLSFVPEVVTSVSVEGELRAFAGGRRKIEVIKQ